MRDFLNNRAQLVPPDLSTAFLSVVERRNPQEKVPIDASQLSEKKQSEIIAAVLSENIDSKISNSQTPLIRAISYIEKEARLYDGYDPQPRVYVDAIHASNPHSWDDQSTGSSRDFDINQTHKYGARFMRGMIGIAMIANETTMRDSKVDARVILSECIQASTTRTEEQIQFIRSQYREDLPPLGYSLTDLVTNLANVDGMRYGVDLLISCTQYFTTT